MSIRLLSSVLCGVLLASGTLASAAQEQAPPGAASTSGPYIQGGLVFTVAPEGVANHRVMPPVSGEAVGVSVGAGWFVTPAIAFEAEVVREGTVSTTQRFSYSWTEDYTAESRDILLTGNVRWRASRFLDVVGGAGPAFDLRAKRDILRTEASGAISSLPDQTESAVRAAIAFGVDGRFRAGTRAEVGPYFRFRWVHRPSDEDFGDTLGVSGHAFNIGVVLRVRL